MIYLLILWVLILSGLGTLFWRELEAYRGVKNSGQPADRAKSRFRRRVLGIGVLFLLLVSLQIGEFYEESFGYQQKILFYLMCMVMLIWVLILATRDFRDLAMSYSAMRTEMTLKALQELEREFSQKSSNPEDQLIPPLSFQKPGPEAQSTKSNPAAETDLTNPGPPPHNHAP